MPPIEDREEGWATYGPTEGNVLFGSEADDEDDAEGDEEQGYSTQAEIGRLQGTIVEMQKQLKEMQTMNMTLMQGGVPVQQQQAPQPAPKEEELPDMYDDPAGYAKALRQQIKAEVMREVKQGEQEREAAQSEQQKYQALWSDFQEKYPEFAADPRRVKFAAGVVAERASRKGLDLNKYMFVYRDQFMEDVAAEMKDVFGGKEADDDDEDEDKYLNVRDKRRQPPEDAAGMFGGRTGRKAKPKGQGAQDGPDTDPFGDLRDFQIKFGYHA